MNMIVFIYTSKIQIIVVDVLNVLEKSKRDESWSLFLIASLPELHFLTCFKVDYNYFFFLPTCPTNLLGI